METLSRQTFYESVREYLRELAESGIDGLPESDETKEKNINTDLFNAQMRTSDSPPETLESLRQKIGDCKLCTLSSSRKNLVFGAGNEKARLVFVGEAPGADEDRQGIPFVGEAGGILTRIIRAIGFTRDEIYICNVLKCRPPANRNPHKEEIASCSPFLIQQLEIIKPEVIVTLGTFATQTLLNTKEPISRLRGKFHLYHGIPLMPTFHPSFLLRNKGNKQYYWDVWSDMVQVLQKLNLPVPEKNQGQG